MDVFNSKQILIIGIGGTGSVIANLLSKFDCVNLTLLDYDKVEVTNLNRQTFFTHKDIGKFKVDVAKSSYFL